MGINREFESYNWYEVNYCAIVMNQYEWIKMKLIKESSSIISVKMGGVANYVSTTHDGSTVQLQILSTVAHRICKAMLLKYYIPLWCGEIHTSLCMGAN